MINIFNVSEGKPLTNVNTHQYHPIIRRGRNIPQSCHTTFARIINFKITHPRYARKLDVQPLGIHPCVMRIRRGRAGNWHILSSMRYSYIYAYHTKFRANNVSVGVPIIVQLAY